MAILYIITVIVVGFFTYKYNQKDFEDQAHIWSRPDKDGYTFIKWEDEYSWVDRRAAWLILITALLWFIMVPAGILILILNYTYNKFNNQFNKKEEKQDEKIKSIEHEIANDDRLSDDAYGN